MKLFHILLILAISSTNAFLLATRAVKSPGFSLNSLQQKKAQKSKVVPKSKVIVPKSKVVVPKSKVVQKKKPQKKATVAKSTDAKEWRLFGRDRDSKTPPLFLKLYDGSTKIGKYPELSVFKKSSDDVKRNPYKNNAPL